MVGTIKNAGESVITGDVYARYSPLVYHEKSIPGKMFTRRQPQPGWNRRVNTARDADSATKCDCNLTRVIAPRTGRLFITRPSRDHVVHAITPGYYVGYSINIFRSSEIKICRDSPAFKAAR